MPVSHETCRIAAPGVAGGICARAAANAGVLDKRVAPVRVNEEDCGLRYQCLDDKCVSNYYNLRFCAQTVPMRV